jgi:glycine/D-amino acid oxidase-like deaminating enzyme
LLADLDEEGMDAMLYRVEERWHGLLELRKELGDTAIGFGSSGGHEIYARHDPRYTLVAARFDHLNEALHPIFGRTAFRWEDKLIRDLGFSGVDHLAMTDLEGPLDSGMLMDTLLRKAISEGVRFRPNWTVTRIEDGTTHVELVLADAQRLNAERVVVATNGYATELLPDLDVRPARGQVLLTEPIKGLRLKGTFHYDEGFFYFREYQGAVLLGGGRNLDIEGETTSADGTTAIIQNELERLLKEVILPGKEYGIAQRWSGIMAMGKSKTPIIEHVSPRVVAAVRLGGMGVAIGVRVARKAAELLS